MMNENMCYEIHGFESPAEYSRFVDFVERQVSLGVSVEVSVDPGYGVGQIYGGRWFRHNESGEIWRLVEPDFPFRGVWERVSAGRS